MTMPPHAAAARRLVAAILAVLMLAVPALAHAGPRRDLSPEEQERRWKRVDMVRMWKMAEVLDLNEDEMAALIPLLRDYHNQWRTLAVKRETALKDLRSLAMAGDDTKAKEITSKTNEILELEDDLLKLRRTHYEAMKQHLSPTKLAKYLLFEIRFQREIQRFMNDARDGRRGPRGGRPFQSPPPSDEGFE